MTPTQRIHRSIKICFLLAALAFSAQGCGVAGPQVAAPGSQEGAPFRPATQAAVEPTATESLPTATAKPTIAPDCVSNLTFITDVTIPDGTEVYPGAIMDKRWEVKNSGTCNWGEGYVLRLTAGDDLQANPEQPLFPARSGSQTTVQITFQAPGDPGVYRSAWQAFDPAGEAFGDPIYIEIKVAAPVED